MMTRFITLVLVAFIYLQNATAQVPVIGRPCQGCELVFVGMPETLKTHSRIAQENEKGEALILRGTVLKPSGNPAVGIIVYAYQTDADGHYPKGPTRHGGLRGWAITDSKGQYSFKTIRPRAYPGRDIPEHIHLHVIEPNKGTYYIDDVTFDDDPLLTAEHRQKEKCRAGCGLSHPIRDKLDVWKVQRNITLGEAIPNY
jgi:protocatechuate 3,4-dioxygenase beta subunit